MTAVLVSLALVGVALLIEHGLRLRLRNDLLIATARALVQLTLLALVIDAVFAAIGWTGLVLVVMLVAAAVTSARRMRGVPSAGAIAAAVIAAASGVAIVVLFATGAFPLRPQYLIPIGGMLIGNSMTAVSVAGSRVRDEIVQKKNEIEARLALGATARTALLPHVRGSVTTALIPIVDSTKNAGLIFLPGAFVGMLLGGATPAEAAQLQLVVLFMLLGAVAVAGMGAALLVSRRYIGEGDTLVLPRGAGASDS